jgi:hypothetical protein
LVQSWRPSPARQATSILIREYREGELILCGGGVGNQVYWEWTRRLGRSGRIQILRPGAPPQPLTPQQQRGREMDELLSALPWGDLEELELAGLDRVWLLASGKEMTFVVDFLRKSGFPSARSFRAGPLSLSVFAKVPTRR